MAGVVAVGAAAVSGGRAAVVCHVASCGVGPASRWEGREACVVRLRRCQRRRQAAALRSPFCGAELRATAAAAASVACSASRKSVATAASAAVTDMADVVEPQTGLHLPTSLYGSKLEGYGCRSKKIVLVSIKAYAIGLYLDEEALKSAIGDKYRGKSADDLKKSSEFYSDVSSVDINKATRLNIAYGGIKGSDIANAFNERLVPAMQTPQEKADLASFQAYFSDVKLQHGSLIDFAWSKGYVLDTYLDNNKLGTITSESLCKNLFIAWYGDASAVPDAKQRLADSLAKVLG